MKSTFKYVAIASPIFIIFCVLLNGQNASISSHTKTHEKTHYQNMIFNDQLNPTKEMRSRKSPKKFHLSPNKTINHLQSFTAEQYEEKISRIFSNDSISQEKKAELRNLTSGLFEEHYPDREPVLSYFSQLIFDYSQSPEKLAVILESLLLYKPHEISDIILDILDSNDTDILFRTASALLTHSYSDIYQYDENIAHLDTSDRLLSSKEILNRIQDRYAHTDLSDDNKQILRHAHLILNDIDSSIAILESGLTQPASLEQSKSISQDFYDTFLGRTRNQPQLLNYVSNNIETMSEISRHQLLMKLNGIKFYESSTLSSQINTSIDNILREHGYLYNRSAYEEQIHMVNSYSR